MIFFLYTASTNKDKFYAPISENVPYLNFTFGFVLCWSLTTVSFAWCRNGMVGHPSVGGDQLLPGSTIALGLFLWLLVAP
jgi:hypothetical protein